MTDHPAATVAARPLSRRRLTATGLAGILALTAAACGREELGGGAGDVDGSAGGNGAFPVRLSSCGAELHFDAPPQRIVLLESAPVTTLDGIGVLDRVVARAGAFPMEDYSRELTARIEGIPELSEDLDASGHLLISQEVVIAQRPDIVFGLPDGLTREGLRDAGAEVMVQSLYCAGGGERASFEALHAEIRRCGLIFDRAAEAEELSAALARRIESVRTAHPTDVGTAAALYPSIGAGPLYAYGAGSMVTAQLDALGIENSFGDVPDRVLEVGAESLIEADPEVLIVLHQGEDDGAGALARIREDAQLSGLRAVAGERVLPLRFNLAEPASPLVVDGLEQLGGWLDQAGER
ncbi:ABC transporter substrate-binding protein [Brachybacterium sp. YJGR34]|uniref:ABC transporter substrate-binding protein n=1 Tax=Brachybacterium sp. YJGR34 TaxID=2059911 RepID=UPI000E0C739E|nr:ABC transporter substrate-binding protein [Brachybacterium sp. YJGR34]